MPRSERRIWGFGIWRGNGRLTGWFLSGVVTVVLVGCQAAIPCCRRHVVSDELQSRMGAGLGQEVAAGETVIPSGINFHNGMNEDEAVSIALWNNAAFLATLAELGISRAQLLDAGLIPDPQFSIFFPLGPKQLEFTGFQAIDALWLRPIRVRAAELDLCRVADQMVQNGLDVIRDVRSAHADLVQAQRRAELMLEAQKLRHQIATLTRKRLDAGDISELETASVQVDYLQASAASQRASHDVSLARERLRVLLGLTLNSDEIKVVNASPVRVPDSDVEALVAAALANRPDLRAAEIQIEAAGQRLGLARHQYMQVDVILDANSRGTDGFEAGLGLRPTIPIFNRNQGGIAIADANLQRAARRYVTVRDQIALELRMAHTQLLQASENLEVVRHQIMPSIEAAVELARKNFQGGGVAYFLVLQTTQQLIDSQIQEVELEGALRRALAELERSIGHRLVAESIDEPEGPSGDADRKQSAEKNISTAGWRATAASSSVSSIETAEQPTTVVSWTAVENGTFNSNPKRKRGKTLGSSLTFPVRAERVQCRQPKPNKLKKHRSNRARRKRKREREKSAQKTTSKTQPMKVDREVKHVNIPL